MEPEMVALRCKPCIMCGRQNVVAVTASSLEEYKAGVKVQAAFDYLTAAERELIISGTCPGCFDTLFPPDE